MAHQLGPASGENDNANQLTQMTYPDGRVMSYARDALERVSGIQATVNRAPVPIGSTLMYRADSTLAAMTLGNGITETRGYDPVGRLVSQIVGTVDARTYVYNAVGDMTGKQTSAEIDQFTYDGLDRLIGEGRAQGSTTHSNGFGYDPNNNRLTETRDGALTSFSYTPNSNRLVQIGSSALTLDSTGNTTADLSGTRKFNYSAANHLQWISQNGLPIAGYLYDGLGQRTGKLTLQGISLYHYDIFGHLISETTIGSQPSRDYVWAGSTPIAQIDHWVPIGSMLQIAHCSVGADGKIDWVTYLHTDGLGTPRVGTDVNKNVVWRLDGEAFGETAPTQAVPSGAYPVIVNLRNPGQYYDQETGFFYNVARYYNPQSGRYITSDPIGLGGGLNSYAYVGGNPVSLTDPLGLCAANPTSAHCFGVAASAKGLSIGLDIIGAIPVFGNVASAASGIARAGIALNHVVTSPAASLASGAYGAYGAIAAGPDQVTDSIVGAGSASVGIAATAADIAVGGTKALPIVGNIASVLTGGWDAYQAYLIYLSCMAGN